jgi:hypothetical protein
LADLTVEAGLEGVRLGLPFQLINDFLNQTGDQLFPETDPLPFEIAQLLVGILALSLEGLVLGIDDGKIALKIGRVELDPTAGTDLDLVQAVLAIGVTTLNDHHGMVGLVANLANPG